MKHDPTQIKGFPKWPYRPYWDSIEEIDDQCRVYIPGINEPKEMTEAEMRRLARDEDWYVIIEDSNFGVCDHWYSIPFMKWIDDYYCRYIKYQQNDKSILGYARKANYVSLTKEKNFSKSEIWNS